VSSFSLIHFENLDSSRQMSDNEWIQFAAAVMDDANEYSDEEESNNDDAEWRFLSFDQNCDVQFAVDGRVWGDVCRIFFKIIRQWVPPTTLERTSFLCGIM